jgi:hypothetical protein
MPIQILSCSAEFYIATQQRNLTAYEIIPLQIDYSISQWSGYPMSELEEKAKEAGCEVITNPVQVDITTNHRRLMATGLRLKKAADEKTEAQSEEGEQ